MRSKRILLLFACLFFSLRGLGQTHAPTKTKFRAPRHNKVVRSAVSWRSKYSYVDNFIEGLARVVKNKKVGIADTSGQEIVGCEYDYISKFDEGLAKVEKNDFFGYINRCGNEVVQCRYRYVDRFRNNRLLIEK